MRVAVAGGKWKWQMVFSPHLLPVSRGILSTIYVNLPEGVDAPRCAVALTPSTANRLCICCPRPGLRRCSTPSYQSLRHRTDLCAGHTTRHQRRPDNLLKGASGQAVQNMNVMFGLTKQPASRRNQKHSLARRRTSSNEQYSTRPRWSFRSAATTSTMRYFWRNSSRSPQMHRQAPLVIVHGGGKGNRQPARAHGVDFEIVEGCA